MLMSQYWTVAYTRNVMRLIYLIQTRYVLFNTIFFEQQRTYDSLSNDISLYIGLSECNLFPTILQDTLCNTIYMQTQYYSTWSFVRRNKSNNWLSNIRLWGVHDEGRFRKALRTHEIYYVFFFYRFHLLNLLLLLCFYNLIRRLKAFEIFIY